MNGSDDLDPAMAAFLLVAIVVLFFLAKPLLSTKRRG